MNDTVKMTFTSEQYKWVMAIANDTFHDATNWLYQTEDDGSEVYARQVKHNKRIMALALAVLEIKAES